LIFPKDDAALPGTMAHAIGVASPYRRAEWALRRFGRSMPSDLIRGWQRFASIKRVKSRTVIAVSIPSKRQTRRFARYADQQKSSM
jgi:hypothetical protein